VREINYRTKRWEFANEVDFIKNIGKWCCKDGVCNERRIKLLEGYIKALKYRNSIKGKKRLAHIAQLEIQSTLGR